MEHKQAIREFIVENFLFGEANGLEEETSFLENGIIDSTGILELVTYLEETFGIEVEDERLHAEAIEWRQTRGAMSGRVAWQFVQDLAGRDRAGAGLRLGERLARGADRRGNGLCLARGSVRPG